MPEAGQVPRARPTLREMRVELFDARLRDVAVADDDERARAAHEAAHAVANHRYGFEVVRVTIDPERGYPGHCEARPTDAQVAAMPPASQRRVARRKIVMLIVGDMAAEKVAEPRPPHEACGDDELIRKWARYRMPRNQVGGTLPQAFWQRVQRQAAALRDEPRTWMTIMALADVLLERRTLTGDEFRHVMADIERAVGATPSDLIERQDDAG